MYEVCTSVEADDRAVLSAEHGWLHAGCATGSAPAAQFVMSLEGFGESYSQIDAQLNTFLQQIIAQEDSYGDPYDASAASHTNDFWLSPVPAAVSVPVHAAAPAPPLSVPGVSQHTATQQSQPQQSLHQQQSSQQQQSALPSGSAMHGGAPASGAMKRSRAWSEKNRRAQQRFRERQKVILLLKTSP